MFADARLKIKRAEQHIYELQARWNAFLKTDFYRLWVETDPQTGRGDLKFAVTEKVPRAIALVIGDAIHNTRAALDYVAWAVVNNTGVTPGPWVKFPFFATRKKLVDALNGGQIKDAGPDIVTLIVERVRPYGEEGGNHPLWALHTLDITDKHLLLIPTIQVSALTNVSLEADNNVRATGVTISMSDDISLMTPLKGFPGLRVKDQGQPTGNILFGEGQPFHGESIIPTLHQLTQLVTGIIDQFGQTYLARLQTPTVTHGKENPGDVGASSTLMP